MSMHMELERVLELMAKGEVEESLQLITNFEKLENITPVDEHYYRFFKGSIFLMMGRVQESLKIVEQDYQENKKLNKPLFLIDAIFLKWNISVIIGPRKWEDVVLCEKLLRSITEEPPLEVEVREGFLFCMKGYFSFWEQKYDEAIEFHKKCLLIFEKYAITSILIPLIFNILGLSYTAKGELDLALESLRKCIELSKGNNLPVNVRKGTALNSIGEIYFQKGDLDHAIEYHKKGLKIYKQYTAPLAVFYTGLTYYKLLKVSLYKNSREEAKKCLVHFSQYLEKNKISKNFLWYRLSRALALRSSSRVRERAEAEDILKEIIKGHKASKSIANRGLPDEFTEAIIELCNFYFEELHLTNDLKILDDIQPLIIRLLKESERTNSYTLQAQTYLLYGKISLLLLNMGDARRYLTQAQQVADDNGLQLLAREISREHDKLLEQLDKWEEFNKSNASISERIALASLEESVELLQRKRSIKPPDLTNEEPVLLLILAGGGILLFSYPFSDEVKVDDELFGGFLSAISTFSDEALSEGLDRAKFGQYTVLIENLVDFSFCYLFKGQTYLAKKKLSNFTENFQKNTSMMQTLKKFNQTSQVIELKDFPFLEGFIKGIFTNS